MKKVNKAIYFVLFTFREDTGDYILETMAIRKVNVTTYKSLYKKLKALSKTPNSPNFALLQLNKIGIIYPDANHSPVGTDKYKWDYTAKCVLSNIEGYFRTTAEGSKLEDYMYSTIQASIEGNIPKDYDVMSSFLDDAPSDANNMDVQKYEFSINYFKEQLEYIQETNGTYSKLELEVADPYSHHIMLSKRKQLYALSMFPDITF